MMSFRFVPNEKGEITQIILDPGELRGNERCGNLASSVKALQIENPARCFARSMHANAFDCFSEKELEGIAMITNVLSDAWVYNPVVQNCDGRDMRPHMNGIMLLPRMSWIIYKQMQVLHDNGLMDYMS